MQKIQEAKQAAGKPTPSGRNLRAKVMKPVAQQAQPSKENNASWNQSVAQLFVSEADLCKWVGFKRDLLQNHYAA
eukprot:scaffold54883_cov39-Prasinocladus_malaysianus.AAC.1